MKTGRLIFLDGLLYFIVYGYFLTVYHFFYSLAVFVLAGNFSLNSNLFEVILLSYCHSDQSLSDLADFLRLSLGCNDLAVV